MDLPISFTRLCVGPFRTTTNLFDTAVRVSAEMVIPTPPAPAFRFWPWIERQFPACHSTELEMLMTATFKCCTLSDLKFEVTNFNPTSLIELLGEDAYDFWIPRLINLHILIHFVFKYFWDASGYDIPLTVPCRVWFQHRDRSSTSRPTSFHGHRNSQRLQRTRLILSVRRVGKQCIFQSTLRARPPCTAGLHSCLAHHGTRTSPTSCSPCP